MPTRLLRDGILSSERVSALTFAEEVFYRRLMSVVDDYGRWNAHKALIRAACYPLQLDKVSDSDVGKWLLATEKAGLVRVYPAQDGKRYLEILDFGQRIQSKSKYPDPVDNGENPESTVDHGGSPEKTALVGVGVGVGVEGVIPRKRGKKPKLEIPAAFDISERVKAWANEKGHTQLDLHLESFKAKCAAHGYTYADWDAAFMEAIRTDWAKLQPQTGRGGTQAASPRVRVDL